MKFMVFNTINKLRQQIQKPSFEVAPTKLPVVLFIYSLQFKSAFSSCFRVWFPSFTLRLSTKNNVFLLLLWTFIYDLELQSWPRYWVKLNHRVKYLGQRSFCTIVIVRTHTQQIDCSIWTTKRSVKRFA